VGTLHLIILQNVLCKTKATIIFYFKPQQRNIGIYYNKSLTPTYCKDMPFLVAEIIKTTDDCTKDILEVLLVILKMI
jgi:hypothetical protein